MTGYGTQPACEKGEQGVDSKPATRSSTRLSGGRQTVRERGLVLFFIGIASGAVALAILVTPTQTQEEALMGTHAILERDVAFEVANQHLKGKQQAHVRVAAEALVANRRQLESSDSLSDADRKTSSSTGATITEEGNTRQALPAIEAKTNTAATTGPDVLKAPSKAVNINGAEQKASKGESVPSDGQAKGKPLLDDALKKALIDKAVRIEGLVGKAKSSQIVRLRQESSARMQLRQESGIMEEKDSNGGVTKAIK